MGGTVEVKSAAERLAALEAAVRQAIGALRDLNRPHISVPNRRIGITLVADALDDALNAPLFK